MLDGVADLQTEEWQLCLDGGKHKESIGTRQKSIWVHAKLHGMCSRREGDWELILKSGGRGRAACGQRVVSFENSQILFSLSFSSLGLHCCASVSLAISHFSFC